MYGDGFWLHTLNLKIWELQIAWWIIMTEFTWHHLIHYTCRNGRVLKMPEGPFGKWRHFAFASRKAQRHLLNENEMCPGRLRFCYGFDCNITMSAKTWDVHVGTLNHIRTYEFISILFGFCYWKYVQETFQYRAGAFDSKLTKFDIRPLERSSTGATYVRGPKLLL